MGCGNGVNLVWNLHLTKPVILVEISRQLEDIMSMLLGVARGRQGNGNIMWIPNCSRDFIVKSCYKLLLGSIR